MRMSRVGMGCALLALAVVLAGQTPSFGAVLTDFVAATGVAGGIPTSTVQLVRGGTSGTQAKTYGNTSGGEFRVEVKNSSGAWETLDYQNADDATWAYKTFCLELNEHLSVGTEYTATIDDAAWYGKSLRPGSTTSPEAILAESALLYGLYFEGRLDDFTSFAYKTTASANDLQKALWAFEEGTSLSSGQTGYDLWTWATANVGTDYGLAGTVKVLNLWTKGHTSGETYAKQSQFIYVEDSGDTTGVVPEPASLAIWAMLGLVGLSPLRRRRRARNR